MTMFTGFPGEKAADIDETTAYLAKHELFIERVPIYRFQIMSGTRFAQLLEQSPRKRRFAKLAGIAPNHRQALIEHQYEETSDPSYRRAISRLLKVIHHINRKPLRSSAVDFEGVM